MRTKAVEKEQAQILRRQGKSLKEITQFLGVAKSTASIWVRNVHLTKTQRVAIKDRELRGATRGREAALLRWQEYRKLHPKPKQNLSLFENHQRTGSFFDSWNEKSAYVLGYFAADGCMYHSRNGGFYNGGYYLQFDSTDQELITIVKDLMGISNKTEHKLPWSDEKMVKKKLQYKLRFTSKKSFQRLLHLGFTPSKSLTLKFPTVPKKYLPHFVRGYFDGDGCVYFGELKRKDTQNIRHVLIARFTCGSREFLEKLQQNLLQFAGIGPGSLHTHSSVWDLAYSAKDSRQLYNFMYPTDTVPCLQRKKAKFEKAFAIMGSHGPVV